MKRPICFVGLCCVLACVPAGLSAGDGVPKLWNEWKENPDAHPYVANFSYAGYRHGEKPIPTFPVMANVKDFGAAGDGRTDDTDAIRKALMHVEQKFDEDAFGAAGAAVYLPPGTYKVTDMLSVSSRIALRGAGPDKTTIYVPVSLEHMSDDVWEGKGRPKWYRSGGVINLGPFNRGHANHKVTGRFRALVTGGPDSPDGQTAPLGSHRISLKKPLPKFAAVKSDAT